MSIPEEPSTRSVSASGHETQPSPRNSSRPPERRSVTPDQLLNRRLFDQLANLIHRYSSEPFQKDEDSGEYVMPDKKVRELLESETEELKHKGALIHLLLHLESLEKDPKEQELYVGSYKVVWPSIKQLNDVYLGPNQTDDFIHELHTSIRDVLGQDKAQMLRVTFKSGIFVVDLSQIRATLNGGTQNHIKERMAEIQQIAKGILLTHIAKRQKVLEEKLNGDDLEKIYQNIRYLDELREELLGRKRGIDIAFGFDELKDPSPDGAFTSILQTERAANLAAVDSKYNGHSNGNGMNGEKKETVKARQYNHTDLITNFLVAFDKVEQEVLDKGKIKPGWEQFFTLVAEENPNSRVKTHSIRMQKGMIEIYRRIDKFRLSTQYRGWSSQEQEDFEKKLAVFGEYYQRINVVDVLKDTTDEHLESYFRRIQKIIQLIKESENALNAEEQNPLHQRELLSKISTELEISLKDRGTGQIQTTRSAIKALMSGDNAVIAETDNIGFGIRNQRDYENSVHELVRLFGMKKSEWKEVRGQKSKMKAFIQNSIEEISRNPRFIAILRSIGDAGTHYLRSNEEHLSEVFGGFPVINADGGDETSIVYSEALGCSIPEDAIAIEKKLLEMSKAHRVRIAAVTGDQRFAPIADPNHVTDENRQQILRYIRGKHWAEEAHGYIKALNEKGLLAVEVTKTSSV